MDKSYVCAGPAVILQLKALVGVERPVGLSAYKISVGRGSASGRIPTSHRPY